MEHEYALIGGINRAYVGRYIGVVAASVSAGAVFVLLTAFDLAKQFGVGPNLPPTLLSLVAAGTIFTILYALFSQVLWKCSPLNRWLKVPDLAGDWKVIGQSLHEDGSPKYDWSGLIKIVQTWDKLRVRLRTDKSRSNSIAAALICDEADGYRLLFDYRNEPNIEQTELKSHRGFAEITFPKDCTTGEGEYFNGHGRFTFGTLRLVRIDGKKY